MASNCITVNQINVKKKNKATNLSKNEVVSIVSKKL